MRKRNAVLLGLIALVVLFFAGGSTVRYFGQAHVDQPIAITFNTDGKADWVQLHNSTDEPFPLAGLVLSDGGNMFPLPNERIPAMGTFTVASSRDKDQLSVEADAYWGDWGFREEEIILVYNRLDRSIVDYYLPDHDFPQRQGSGMAGSAAAKSDGSQVLERVNRFFDVFERFNGAWSTLVGLAGWFARRLWPDSDARAAAV